MTPCCFSELLKDPDDWVGVPFLPEHSGDTPMASFTSDTNPTGKQWGSVKRENEQRGSQHSLQKLKKKSIFVQPFHQ
jgi:hypothetical protein